MFTDRLFTVQFLQRMVSSCYTFQNMLVFLSTKCWTYSNNNLSLDPSAMAFV